MKFCLILRSVLLISVIGARATPTDDDVPDAPKAVADAAEADSITQPPSTERRLDELSKSTASQNIKSKTKDKKRVKVRYDRHGNRIIEIKDVSKTKTKSDEVTDDFKQVNHTLTEGGIEDSSSETDEKQHELKKVEVKKKTDTERIVVDRYGNIVSDSHKIKEKDKVKQKEKNKEISSYEHTVKKVPPPEVPADEAAEAPAE